MNLTPEFIEAVNKLCFRENDKNNNKVDLIYIFGSLSSSKNMLEALYELLDNNVSNRVLISGGINPRRKTNYTIGEYSTANSSEAKIIEALFNKQKYPDVEIILEERSSNTKENVEFSLNELKKAKSIFFICKAYHAGRAYLTLKKYLPNSNILQKSYAGAGSLNTPDITAENWYFNEGHKDKVIDEFNKIYKYGLKGDIEFSEKELRIYKKLPDFKI